MIHLTGCTLNLYNRSLFYFKLPTGYIISFLSKNGSLWSPVPLAHFDNLNLNHSATKLSTQSTFKTFSVFEIYYLYFWRRITFRGKSYRIKFFKRLNKFTFSFNYSHWMKIKLFTTWAISRRKKKKERDRQRYIIYTDNFFFLPSLISTFKNIRQYNSYTMRGLRLRSQPIIRRFGKLSQHVSILH